MNGVIYKYTSPSGKHYIGQTCREHGRRNDFQEKGSYGGTLIDNARAKYGAENFDYEVIFSITSDDATEVHNILNKKEAYFIELYKSNDNRFGYNMNEGGSGNVGMEVSQETRRKIGESTRRWIAKKGHPLKGVGHTAESIEKMRRNTRKKFGKDNPNYGWKPPRELIERLSAMARLRTGEKATFYGRHHTKEVKDFLRNKFGRKVIQYDAKSHEKIAEFISAGLAAETLGLPRSAVSEICKVCNKYVRANGIQSITAYGYRWKWADDTDNTFSEARIPPPPSFKGCHVSEENKRNISRINSKKVKQIDVLTGEVIAIHDSATKAAIALGKPKSNSDIGKLCNGKLNRGKVLGYKWEWV